MAIISQNNKEAFRNPWVLGWLALLATVLLVNAGFIFTAFQTSPGLVDDRYYEKGRDVEKNFHKKLEARNRLGWHMNLTTPETITVGKPGNFVVNIADKAGMAMPGAKVTLHAYRPSDASADFTSDMDMLTGGVYQKRLALPLKGIWDIMVKVSHGEDELELSRRVTVLAP